MYYEKTLHIKISILLEFQSHLFSRSSDLGASGSTAQCSQVKQTTRP